LPGKGLGDVLQKACDNLLFLANVSLVLSLLLFEVLDELVNLLLLLV
jgi:hypothetical protein